MREGNTGKENIHETIIKYPTIHCPHERCVEERRAADWNTIDTRKACSVCPSTNGYNVEWTGVLSLVKVSDTRS